MTGTTVHYATNVFHYDQALAAMRNHFTHIVLQRRYEPDSRLLDTMRLVPGSGALRSRFERRVRSAPDVDRLEGLGLAQFAFPLLGLVGLPAPGRVVRDVNHLSAERVAAELREVEVFQFVEGLGHVALTAAAHRFDHSIMERRNLHHEVFEEPIDVFQGFPHRSRLDPLRDYLIEEYARTDQIITYSTVAARSFLDRGFDPAKIQVVPLAARGIRDLTAIVQDQSAPTNPYSFLYVGRGDAFKGLDLAVAAVEALGPPFSLKVAGPASRGVIEWMSRFDQIEYLGVASRDELGVLYEHSAALLAPSVESFGLAIIDAAAHGLHVLCRETTGASEFLSSSQVTIVPGRDLQDWVAAIDARARAPRPRRGEPTLAARELTDGTLSRRAFERVYSLLR